MIMLIASIGSISVKAGNVEDLIIWLKGFGPEGDITNDGEINVDDVSSLVNQYGEVGEPGWIREDINRNGEVEVDDVSLLVDVYGINWLT
jgi:hypothetical protein